MGPLEGGIQNYAWGSHAHISNLRGLPRSDRPEAEVWFGDHPVLPSQISWHGASAPLGEIIRADASGVLGSEAASQFGARLPFLLKLLAAETPLSLQAHPSAAQAREGFAREEAAHIPRSAAHRNYKDENHKPELLCALTPFQALCGFRTPDEVRAIFGAIGIDPVRVGLPSENAENEADVLRGAFEMQFALTKEERAALCRDVVSRAASAKLAGRTAEAIDWMKRIAAIYPDDLGVVQMLFLNLVTLAPFEAIYLPAGNLHAYLGGFGVEIMASSDNVLRGGLTPKHVDERELMRVLDFTPRANWRVEPRPRTQNGASTQFVYPTPVAEFELSRLVLEANGSLVLDGTGPHVVVATRGSVEVARGSECTRVLPGAGAFIENGATFAVRAIGTERFDKQRSGGAGATEGRTALPGVQGEERAEAFVASLPFPPTQ